MINLIYLKYFCDAVKYGSVSEAARLNFVTQSAISQGIVKLEESLTTPLITHQPNSFQITPEGQAVFKHAKEIFAQVNSLHDVLQTKKEGHLDFACLHSFSIGVLPAALKRFAQKCPLVKVNFQLGRGPAVSQLLKMGLIDFGIVLDDEHLLGFERREIYKGNYRLFVSKKVKPKAREKLGFIIAEETKETDSLRKSYQRKYGKELPIQLKVASWEVIANLTEQGLGIGLFPDYVALNKKQLVEHELELDPLPYHLDAVHIRGTTLSKNAELFLTLVQTAFG